MKYKTLPFLVLILFLISPVIITAEVPREIVPVDQVEFTPLYAYSSPDIVIVEQDQPEPTKPIIKVPSPPVIVVPKSTPKPKVSAKGFKLDNNVSWYGPGFYGGKTACGQKYTKTILGVAHKTLPCGTLVTFMWKGNIQTVPVIDRGPYVAGRQWDLSGGLCVALNHCFTGKIYYRLGK